MSELFKALFESLTPNNNVYDLSAIWMNKPVITGSGERTIRLAPDMTIRVENEVIVDCGEPTHKIVGCIGTINNSYLAFVLLDINTNEPSELKVK